MPKQYFGSRLWEVSRDMENFQDVLFQVHGGHGKALRGGYFASCFSAHSAEKRSGLGWFSEGREDWNVKRRIVSSLGRPAGFTLLETIVVFVMLSIFGTLVVAATGKLLTDSPTPLIWVQSEYTIVQQMEQYNATYRNMLNRGQTGVLASLYSTAASASNVNSSQTGYITFSAQTGSMVSSSPSPYLMISLIKDNQVVSNLFTE